MLCQPRSLQESIDSETTSGILNVEVVAVKRQTLETVDGETVTRLIPENDEDSKILQERISNGKLAEPEGLTDVDPRRWQFRLDQ